MNQYQLKKIKEEARRMRRLLNESRGRCEKLLWDMQNVNNDSAAIMNYEKAVRIAQTISDAAKIVDTH